MMPGCFNNTLRYSTLFKDIQSGGGIPNESIILGDIGEIPLANIGDTAFPTWNGFCNASTKIGAT